MFKIGFRLFTLMGLFILTGCTGLGDDNTLPPASLTSYPFQFQPAFLWSASTGAGEGKDYLRLGSMINQGRVFVASQSGRVTALELTHGHKLWQINLRQPLMSGPAVDEGIVIVTSMQPQVIALEAESGDVLWRAKLPNQVLALPVISQGRVILKTVDGKVLAFSLQTGKPLWVYHHGAPTLVLRPSSAPYVVDDKVVVGFSDGVLAALTLTKGTLLWEHPIAFPKGVTQVDQLVDIAADPLSSCRVIYVVTYQGQLAAISLQTGQILWQRSFSSYSGLALGKNLYVSDSEGVVWGFHRRTGRLLWRQCSLQHRGLTAPVIMGNSLVIGDQEGYLHWLAQADGRLLARILVHDDASIIMAPVVRGPFVYVLTREGGLSAWTYTTLPV